MSARLRRSLWPGLMALAGVVLLMQLGSGARLQTDLHALLPDGPGDPGVVAARQQLTEPFARATLWLTGARSPGEAASAAHELATRLDDSGLFSEIHTEIDSTPMREAWRELLAWQQVLLAPADARALRDDPETFVQHRLTEQYGLAGETGIVRLAEDPLGLFRRYLSPMLESPGAAVVDGMMIVDASAERDEEYYFAVLHASVAEAAFAVSMDPPLLALWQEAIEWAAQENITLHVTGAPVFTAWGSASASREITLIGGVSLLAIVALLLWRFRSPRPLLLTLTVIGAGLLGGLATSLLVFGQLHLITLVFGATVIGVSVDYAFHYLCDSLRPGWTPQQGLQHVLPGLRLALVTSVLAFLSLAVAPFPALRQVAVFTASGLIFSWLTVVWLLPLLTRPARAAAPRMRLPVRRIRWVWICLALMAACLPGLFMLEARDDIHLLYAAPERLLADDRLIGDLLQRTEGSYFILVSAADEETLLQRQEALLPGLEALREEQHLQAYRAPVQVIPSRRQQTENAALTSQLVSSGLLTSYMAQLGLGEDHARTHEARMSAPPQWLPVETALRHVDPRYRQLWLGCDDEACRALVTVQGLGDDAEPALEALAAEHPGVQWVNYVGDISQGMREHRRLSLVLLALALVVATAVLALLLGLRQALRVISVPVMAIMVSLAIVGYSGALFSVFNLMALLLIAGVGIDYALFYHCADRDGRRSAGLAITMAATTTVLAFGLLAFSNTPVISAFGITLVPGLVAAWLLALLARPPEASGTGEIPDEPSV